MAIKDYQRRVKKRMKSKESSQQLWNSIRRTDTWGVGMQIATEKRSIFIEIITENSLVLKLKRN